MKSAASPLEAPVVRAIRQELSSVGEPDPDATVAPAMYGRSAESLADEDVTGFAEALATAKAQSKAKGQKKGAQWRPPLLQVLRFDANVVAGVRMNARGVTRPV